MQIRMIGHSTILIETNGQKIITDPYFDEAGNPAYIRLVPPAQPRESLCDVTLVLLSHDHFDHIDSEFLRLLNSKVPVVAPSQTTGRIKRQGAQNILGLKAWQSRQVGETKITAVPAVHTTFTIGFIIESEGRQIYFSGDTYYRPFMKEIGRRFQLDVAMIPVTTFRIPMAMGEKAAVRAVQALSPKVVIPVHLSLMPRNPILRTKHSPEGFERRLRDAGLQTRVIRLTEGTAWRC